MGIAENLKKRRLESVLSQQDLANKLGYESQSTIKKIEVEENAVPKSKITLFAKALDTTPEFLKTGEGTVTHISEHIVMSGRKNDSSYSCRSKINTQSPEYA